MDFYYLRKARLLGYNHEVLDSGHQFQHIVASSLGLATGIKDLRKLKTKRAVAAWEKR